MRSLQWPASEEASTAANIRNNLTLVTNDGALQHAQRIDGNGFIVFSVAQPGSLGGAIRAAFPPVGNVRVVAAFDEAVPDVTFPAEFKSFSQIAVSPGGNIVFQAAVSDSTDDQAIFLESGEGLRLIVRAGDSILSDSIDFGRTFEALLTSAEFDAPAISDDGAVAFRAVTPRVSLPGIPGEFNDIRLGFDTPAGETSAASGNVDVPMLQIELVPEADGLNITRLTLIASGSGDDVVDLARVSVWSDENANGQVDADEPRIASDIYDADNGTIHLSIDPPLAVLPRMTATLLVTYDITQEPPSSDTQSDARSMNDATKAPGSSRERPGCHGGPGYSCVRAGAHAFTEPAFRRQAQGWGVSRAGYCHSSHRVGRRVPNARHKYRSRNRRHHRFNLSGRAFGRRCNRSRDGGGRVG